MKSVASLLLLLIVFSSSCKDDNTHQLEITKALKEKELVYSVISKTWNFSPRNLTPESQVIVNNWDEWRLFISELNQKPKGTIGAFQRKTNSLVQKAEVLSSTIPAKINKPQIISRLMAMLTKIKALHTFISLDRIPEKKTVVLITDLNIQVNALLDQIEEIVRRSHIKKEEGEQEMINSLNGSKPTAEPEKNINSIENQ